MKLEPITGGYTNSQAEQASQPSTMWPKATHPKVQWTYKMARLLLQKIQPIAHERKCHIAIAGSVATFGKSYNDLDLIIVPFDAKQLPMPANALCDIYYKLKLTAIGSISDNNSMGADQSPKNLFQVAVYKTPNGRKIDFWYPKTTSS